MQETFWHILPVLTTTASDPCHCCGCGVSCKNKLDLLGSRCLDSSLQRTVDVGLRFRACAAGLGRSGRGGCFIGLESQALDSGPATSLFFRCSIYSL